MNNHKVGVVLAGFFGLVHAAWALVVASGMAKSLIAGLLDSHFISASYVILPFSLSKAIGLVVMAMIGGYFCGWVFDIVHYNIIRKRCARNDDNVLAVALLMSNRFRINGGRHVYANSSAHRFCAFIHYCCHAHNTA